MALKEWLKPPKSLLLILFLLTLLSVSALGWFGWNLLEQERVVEAQRAQERLEQSADQIAATLRESLAETGERLSAWVSAPPPAGKPDEGLLLLLTGSSLSAMPPERLLYRPFPSPEPEAPADAFAEGEALEFLQNQPQKAAEWYQKLADSGDLTIRAGALMRRGRALRQLGRGDESRSAYAQLAAISGVRVAGAPAELVGRHALAEISAGKDHAQDIRKGLLRGRWHLNRGQFYFYWGEASHLSGHHEPIPPEPAALAEAVAMVWRDPDGQARPAGQRTEWVEGRPFFLMWRGAAGRRAVLLMRPEQLLDRIVAGKQIYCAAVDSEGRSLAGRRSGEGRAAVRTATESQLPWTLYFTGPGISAGTALMPHQRLLMLGILVMVLFLIAGTYFIARVIRREMEVSRLQSHFVAAVSHEFRSPLTSMRQLSELLLLGRVANEDRRKKYYETLVSETERLQRLVETLLNFGRMEAGARQYRFEPMDAASVVRQVVAEFESQIAASGRQIEVKGAAYKCGIDADPEALSLALRNLVDNALKYSPDQPTVWVEWEAENDRVAIRVRDIGAGIAASERKTIFEKFVRGSAAQAGNVKGTGVGLAMVRKIVAAHGGEIQVASEPGQGSTFTMLLPGSGGI